MKKINIKGTIVSSDEKWIYNWLGMPAVCPKDVENVLSNANGEDVVTEINSGGGNLFAGIEIFTMLADYKGNVHQKVLSLAGSAASVLLMAGTSEISPAGMVMAHNCSGETQGDYRAMDSSSELLQKANQSIRNAYKHKTNLDDEELTDIMNKETWMTAEEAVEAGFVDSIMPLGKEEKSTTNIYNSISPIIPEEIINKLKQKIIDGKLPELGNNGISVPIITNSASTEDTSGTESTISNKPKENKGGEPMVLEDVLKDHPEIKNEIDALKDTSKQEGKEEGAKAERERLQAIDNIANNISNELVNKAKYEEPISAEALALQAIQNNVAKASNYMKDAMNDSSKSGVDDVPANPTDADPQDEDDALIEAATKTANAKRKKVK
ncbi:prophage Clp protease-like protein [Lachnospiraceae bacterium KM106-2]|nr:prophage Clp protease-like protein [Lachnospiraceae bacterium KM106-2]